MNLFCNKDPKFNCDHCQHKTHRKCDLVSHMQAKHFRAKHLSKDPLNTCVKCGKSYFWKSDLTRHSRMCGLSKKIKSSDAFKRFCCDLCSYRTYRKDHLVLHIKAHLRSLRGSRTKLRGNSKSCGPKSSKRFSCNDCSYSCVQKQSIMNHIQMKHLNNSFKCTACKKLFKSEYNRRHHAKYACKYASNLISLSCDHCDYKCFRKTDITSHIQGHHMGISYKCGSCRKSFASQLRLIKHSKKTKCKNKK